MNWSVVIPVHNAENELPRALRSVAAQTLRPLEVLVIDDGSTDRTAVVCRKSRALLQLPLQYHSQAQTGPAAARNQGVRLARGDLIAFLDADDEWLPDKLTRYDQYFRQVPNEVAFGMFRYQLSPSEPRPAGFRTELLGRDLIGRLPSTTAATRRFLLTEPYDESFRTAEDVEWFARLTQQGTPLVIVPGVTVLKHVRARSLSFTFPHRRADLMRALRQHYAVVRS